jgi:predicted Zn-dependent protease
MRPRSPERRRAAHRAAGVRTVTLLTLLAFVSACATGPLTIDQERELGDEFARQARGEFDFFRDRLVNAYIEKLGRQILEAAGPQPFDYKFYVLEEGELNAFAAPAGHVYVHTGLILAADNMSELAGVMAHEVGHVARRHIARNYNRQRSTGILYKLGSALLAIFVGGYAANAGALVGQVAAMAYLNTFSRDAEREADAFAVEVLPRAGIHPEGLVSFFETLRAQQQGGRPPAFLSSHPATEERIQNGRAAIAALDLDARLSLEDDGKLEIIQRRIQLLTGEALP